MLEFKELIKWIYATDDNFLKKRAGAIAARAKLVNSVNANEVNYKDIREIIEYDASGRELLEERSFETGVEQSVGSGGLCDKALYVCCVKGNSACRSVRINMQLGSAPMCFE